MLTIIVAATVSVLAALTDTTPAATYTISGTPGPDTVTVSDGPGGTTTVSSPTFENVTFANKTSVVFDGLGGGDTVTFANPTPATGLASFVVTNVGNVVQTAPIRYPAFGVNATGTVTLNGAGNDVDRFEATTQQGDLLFTDVDDLIVGGVAPTLAGARIADAGLLRIDAGGLLALADTDGAEIVRGGANAGNVLLNAIGEFSDVAVTVDRPAAVAPKGQIVIDAGRDVFLGSGGVTFTNDVRAGTGAQVSARRHVIIEGQTRVVSDDFGLNSRGAAVVVADEGEFRLGAGASIIGGGTAGAPVSVLEGTGATLVTLRGALLSMSGDVRLGNLRLLLEPSGSISAPLGAVRIFGNRFELGAATDADGHPALSDAELDRIFAPTVVLRGDILTVSQPVTFTTGTHLVLHFWSHFEASGSGSVDAQTLTFAREILLNLNPKTWTITPTTVGVSGATPVPYSGVTTLHVSGTLGHPTASGGEDTFLVTPSPTTTIYVDGNTGTDTLDFDLTGVAAPVLTMTATPTGNEGSLTSANRAPVNFSDVENIVDAPPPQTPSLRITKSAISSPAYAGATLVYAITLQNASAATATDVVWTDVLPASTTFVSLDAPPSYTCTTGSTITCSVATLAPSPAPDTFTVTVRVNDNVVNNQQLTNTVSVTANGALQGSATTTVIASAMPAAIPTLSEWMLMLLAALLALIALRA